MIGGELDYVTLSSADEGEVKIIIEIGVESKDDYF